MNRHYRMLHTLALLMVVLCTEFVLAYPNASSDRPVKANGCGECHTCTSPTIADPCLRQCPRPRATKAEVAMGPEEVVINEIEYEYEGVVFNHKRHAEMTAVDKGCQSCHHFQEAGGISSCKSCHDRGSMEEHLEQPGLKGAYHRQCLGCHQEWSHDTQCNLCHEKKLEPGPPVAGHYPPRQYKPFGELNEPVKKVWQSTYGGGTVVTLFHQNHTEKYGVDCSSCHHAEGCGACHGKKETTTSVRHSEEALHAICNACHAEMSCDQCHLKAEAQEFSHDRTGWPLSKFHRSLSCKSCHGKPTHFTKPNSECNTCHGKWNETNFVHTRAGFALSENHAELACNECHLNRDFGAVPACANCHEADVAFPASMPGDYVR